MKEEKLYLLKKKGEKDRVFSNLTKLVTTGLQEPSKVYYTIWRGLKANAGRTSFGEYTIEQTFKE